MSEDNKTIIVCGATGKQGGSVVDALLRHTNFNVKAMTRDTKKPVSKLLKNRGVEVVEVDYDNPRSLYNAINGCDGIFVVTNFWEDMNPKTEIKHGIILADVIKETSIKHCVWSCLEDTRKILGDDVEKIGEFKIPHFDAKAVISKYMKKLDLPVTYVYTSFYWENFLDIMKPVKNNDDEYLINIPMGDIELAGVSVEDIGKTVSYIFYTGEETIGRDVGIVGEYVKVEDMANILSKYSGKKYIYKPMSNDEYRNLGFPGCRELANMFLYYTNHIDSIKKIRNIEKLENNYNNTLITFDKWAQKYFNKNMLTYFDRPGNVEPIRILLRIAKVNFYDNRVRNNHDITKNQRNNDDLSKLHLQGLIPFGQLPVYKEDDFVISHMGSILRYIARKYNFEGENEEEKTMADTLFILTDSILTKFFKILYTPTSPDVKNHFKKTELAMLFIFFDKVLENNMKKHNLEKPIYFVGTKITYCDAFIFNCIKSLVSSIKGLGFPESVVTFYKNFNEIVSNL